MGGVCLCYSWTCRPMWPVFIILAAIPCFSQCSESPAAVVGKMYPRGNHWAVGHLMGKKSIKRLPALQEANFDRDYLTPSEPVRNCKLDRHERPMAALQPKNQKQRAPQRLPQLHSSWREQDRELYLRELSDLLHLALKLKDNDFS
ncbi:gastrin-releasing peptide [Odontesthes bonariensis]|uniref:gastrin-releasing peptide n=1 Tax=Odontesthes bonariensis TaxID=219752 RepID=UPI003F58A5F8